VQHHRNFAIWLGVGCGYGTMPFLANDFSPFAGVEIACTARFLCSGYFRCSGQDGAIIASLQ